MADKKLLTPLFDRLIADDDSDQHYLMNTQMRESVRRDLENLLNTRFCCLAPPEEFEHLQSSLLNLGLPDISSVNLMSIENRKRFCAQIRQCILTYEKRIKSVKVSTVGKLDPEEPNIRFQIEAEIHSSPAPEIIVFDSSLNPITQTVNVAEVG
ncbi:type VI secretion system baseplate subunit TssE [Sessilibacter corallicola]|uniref:IraD/Gp25-like domain-containing protein n=1 Tax=Sessilibacter corallicola TaxID=2904075 RepID=A0ABQ0A4W9_9GAMM|nr:type VI secretion system baseplate subunit TssE [Sessilibacter corallicola]MCE2026690.1 type VI secretion system baseplate subunit TssE [Sessilibacter corallicola]